MEINTQRIQMPTQNILREIDYNGNNKTDQIFSLADNKCDILNFADLDEDGLVDVLTDFSTGKSTVWNKDGSVDVFETMDKFSYDDAFRKGELMMSQRVEMPTENIIAQLDNDNSGIMDQVFTVQKDTGWIAQYLDNNEDGLADVVKNYGHHIKIEWREDGSVIASTHMDNTLKGLVDTNGDSVADFRCYDENFNGIWDFEENK